MVQDDREFRAGARCETSADKRNVEVVRGLPALLRVRLERADASPGSGAGIGGMLPICLACVMLKANDAHSHLARGSLPPGPPA